MSSNLKFEIDSHTRNGGFMEGLKFSGWFYDIISFMKLFFMKPKWNPVITNMNENSDYDIIRRER